MVPKQQTKKRGRLLPKKFVCYAGADPALEKFPRSKGQNHTTGITGTKFPKSDRLG